MLIDFESSLEPPFQVVASMNILMSGFTPESPILDATGNCHSLDPKVTDTPICSLRESTTSTRLLKVCVTELRGDWKFLKAYWLKHRSRFKVNKEVKVLRPSG